MQQTSIPARRPAAPAALRWSFSARGVASLVVLVGTGVASSCAVFDGTWDGTCTTDCEPATSSPECAGPADCGVNETCGADEACHSGNCQYWGCVTGYTCAVTDRGTAECVQGAPTGSGGGTSGEGGSGGQGGGGQGGATTSGEGGGTTGQGGATSAYCGNPDDCGTGETCGQQGACERGDCTDVPCIEGFLCGASGSCQRQNAAACGEDADCSGAGGTKCVSGLCTAPEDQCFDQVQCASGSVCADGKCTPACADGAPCPTGWVCDEGPDVCTLPELPCAITDDCGTADRVCVAGACVPRADGFACPPGQIWVENGCIPEQRPTFSCSTEGEQAECALGLLCVHRTCFVPCAPPDEAACDAIPGFGVCKSVPSETGTFAVCGSDANLGGTCDPTLGVACPDGESCIDGTCR